MSENLETKTGNKHRRFVVALPEHLSVIGDIPKVGVSIAYTERQAVAQYLCRMFPSQNRDTGNPSRTQLIMSALDQRKRAENYSFEFPQVEAEDGKPLSENERVIATEVFIAHGLGRIYNSEPEKYTKVAQNIVQKHRFAPIE